jgi:hypothetical protein
MTKPISFEIEVPFDVLCRLFDSNTVSTGTAKEVPGDALIRLGDMPIQKRNHTQDAAPLIPIIVSFGVSVGSKLFADWLSGKMRESKFQRLRFNRKKVEITPDGILRAVEETIEIEHKR